MPRRQADGTGRDAYIIFNNGGLYNNYKPYNYDAGLRGYEVIPRAHFGKKNPDFDDYQKWQSKHGAHSKKT